VRDHEYRTGVRVLSDNRHDAAAFDEVDGVHVESLGRHDDESVEADTPRRARASSPIARFVAMALLPNGVDMPE
jgi:hypothetical protein